MYKIKIIITKNKTRELNFKSLSDMNEEIEKLTSCEPYYFKEIKVYKDEKLKKLFWLNEERRLMVQYYE